MKNIFILFLLIMSAATIFPVDNMTHNVLFEGTAGMRSLFPYAQGSLVNRFYLEGHSIVDLSIGWRLQLMASQPGEVLPPTTYMEIAAAYQHRASGLGISLAYLPLVHSPGFLSEQLPEEGITIKTVVTYSEMIKKDKAFGFYFELGSINKLRFDVNNGVGFNYQYIIGVGVKFHYKKV